MRWLALLILMVAAPAVAKVMVAPSPPARPVDELSAREILEVMKPATMRLRRCLARHTVWPVKVEVQVAASGVVSKVFFRSGDEPGDKTGQDCVVRGLKKLRFPARRDPTSFVYPLTKL